MPAEGRGSENSAGVCPCFHPVSFSPHFFKLATLVALCQLLFNQSVERHTPWRESGAGFPPRDSQLLTPTDRSWAR